MKYFATLLAIVWGSYSFAAATCEPVSPKVFKCTSVYASYITEVSACSESIQTLTGFYKYFTYKVVGLNKTWLEDASGIIPGSLEKIITRDGLRITKDEKVCKAWRDEQAAKLTPLQDVNQAVDQFMNTKN